jgi:Protein of unknown function (DUF3306)
MADTGGPDGNFFGRWSQRKAQARTGGLPGEALIKPVKATELARPAEGAPSAPQSQSLARPLAAAAAEPLPETPAAETRSAPPAPPARPTLQDVANLTADSDYSAFSARTVDPEVRNAAMRKLFAADPHFNVMDGLDVYIDDYSVGEPIPKAMLRQMVQARALGLLDDELEDQDKPPSADVPTALAANDTGPIHENADLQLHRDDAAGHGGADQGPDVEAQPGAATDLAAEPGQP